MWKTFANNSRAGFSATPLKDEPEEFAKILAQWPHILEKMKEYNHSLLSSLKLSQPLRLEGRELVLGFQYKFHKDAIEARKNKIVVDQVIFDITGENIVVKPILQKEGMADENTPVPMESVEKKDNRMESALKIMGGEVE